MNRRVGGADRHDLESTANLTLVTLERATDIRATGALPSISGSQVGTANHYDVTVAYRVYPRISKTPAAFPGDKLKLVELCLRSFRASIGSLRVKLIVLLDGCPPEYADVFRKYFAADDLEVVPLSGIGNRNTFSLQVQLLLDQSYSELIYFAEDDYFYKPGEFEEMVRFMQANADVSFATPYDHLDYYTSALHRYASRTIISEGRRWRSVGSTCLTFLTSRSVLHLTSRVFQTYARGRKNTDFGVWFSLTKLRVRDPLTLLIGLSGQALLLAVVGIAWYYNWRQILFGKRWTLWAPAPSIATHMDSNFLPPGTDWQRIISDAAESIQ